MLRAPDTFMQLSWPQMYDLGGGGGGGGGCGGGGGGGSVPLQYSCNMAREIFERSVALLLNTLSVSRLKCAECAADLNYIFGTVGAMELALLRPRTVHALQPAPRAAGSATGGRQHRDTRSVERCAPRNQVDRERILAPLIPSGLGIWKRITRFALAVSERHIQATARGRGIP